MKLVFALLLLALCLPAQALTMDELCAGCEPAERKAKGDKLDVERLIVIQAAAYASEVLDTVQFLAGADQSKLRPGRPA